MKYSKNAFTLLELLIVITIIGLMMLITYAPYNFYQQKAKVKIASREISQSIDEARNLAVSGIRFNSGSILTNRNIGLLFQKGENTILFYDFPYTSSGRIVDLSEGEIFQEKQLQKSITIGNMEQSGIESDKLLFYFDAITGNSTIRDISGGNIFSEDKFLKIGFGIGNTSSGSLIKSVEYLPKTNTTNYNK